MSIPKGPKEVTNILRQHVEKIDKLYFRTLHRHMHECSAGCYNDSLSSSEITTCLQGCSTRLNEMNNYVNTELTNFQERLQRCVTQCNDEAKDKLSHEPSQKEIDLATKWFEGCASDCATKYINTLPKFMEKVYSVLEKNVSKEYRV